MAANPYLNFDLTINRKEVFSRAWATARAELARSIRLGFVSTLRQCFADALRKHWDLGRGYRSIALWRRDRDAEYAAASAAQRQILALQETIATAPMIDNTATSFRVLADASKRLAEIRQAA